VDALMRVIFLKIIKKLYYVVFIKGTDSKENIAIESRGHSGDKKVTNFEDKFSTRDRTPISKNTLECIALFKNVPKNENTHQNGGFFNQVGTFQKKLSRYQVYINFIVKHYKTYDKLPSTSFIVENCKFENELVFTRKIILIHKEEALKCGDMAQDRETKRYYLVRIEEYVCM
jgi:hypothetical protein